MPVRMKPQLSFKTNKIVAIGHGSLSYVSTSPIPFHSPLRPFLLLIHALADIALLLIQRVQHTLCVLA
jgi:hypothetical protein